MIASVVVVNGQAPTKTSVAPPAKATPVSPSRPVAPTSTQAVVSKEEIARELIKLDADIADAKRETEKYAGGLVKTLIDLRLATLLQSQAMLQQRRLAAVSGVSIHYSVDGKTVTLPTTARDELSSVEREIASMMEKIRDQDAEADRYSGGLVQAMALSTAATSRQTLAMLEQKRLALKFALPQYVGFADQFVDSKRSAAPPQSAVAPAAQDKQWEIVEVDAKVTESNSTWSRFAWKLTVKNTGPNALALEATIEFQDKDGFIVDSDANNRFAVAAGATETVTGYALITAGVAGNVARTVAKVARR
jgi:hypothetical protein